MRFVLYTFVTLLTLLAGAAAFVYVALPTDFVRDELAAQVRSHTGRSLTIAGPVSISFYPEPGVQLEDVRLSPPPGMTGEPALSIRTLALKIPLWPLLQRQLTIERFTLDHPVLVLKTDAQGRRSWDFRRDAGDQPQLRGSEPGDASAAPGTSVPDKAAPAPAAQRIPGLAGLQLKDVQINDGTIQLIDERSGLKETLTGVSLKLALDAIEAPARIEGSVTWSGEPTTVAGTVGPVSNLLSGSSVAIDLAIKGRLAETRIKGAYAQADATPLGGRITLEAGSLRGLLAWLKHPLPAGSGFGKVSLTSDFGLSANGAAARSANLVLDGMTVKGSLSVNKGKDRPMLRAELSIDRLDLNTYLAGGPAQVAKPADAQPAPSQTGKIATAKPTAELAPAAQGDTSWNTQPIDLAALKLADADIALTVGALQWHAIKLGKTAVKSTLKDSILKSRFSEIALYGGKGSGSLTIDGRDAASSKVDSNFALRAIQVQPFLSDAADFNRVAGRGDVAFNFAGGGRSQLDIVKTLQGQGRIELADGAITGVNVAQGIKSLQGGQFGGWDSQPSAKTDFSALTATCTVNNGVLDNRDLVLTAPVLRMSGAGTANLPARTMDYTVQPALTDSTEGQGAADAGAPAAGGLTIPVHLTGPWARPEVNVDLSAIAKNPQAAVDTVKKAVGKFAGTKQGKAIGDLLGGLLGKMTKQADPPADAAPAQ